MNERTFLAARFSISCSRIIAASVALGLMTMASSSVTGLAHCSRHKHIIAAE